MKIINFFLKIFKRTPVYPHWLENINRKRGDKEAISYLSGRVIETGAPSDEYKNLILRTLPDKVKEYFTSDHIFWNQYKKGSEHTVISIIRGSSQSECPDIYCDGTDLPFQNSYFDSYCAFEVLEHITNPKSFLMEAKRVLKNGGVCILSIPFIYREHPSENLDFFRYTRGGIRYLANSIGFKVIKIASFSFIGTAISSLINQFMIRQILEGSYLSKFLFVLICPFLSLFLNIFGLIIDLFYRDERFAARYHIILRKL